MKNHPIWGETEAFTLPMLESDVETDVCVVGLGGSGLACINALAAARKRVVGIDAVAVAAGAAGRNGGFLLGGLAMFHHDAVQRLGEHAATAVYQETLKQIARMGEETPAAVRRTGSLRIATSPEELDDCRRQLEAMRTSGLPVEPYIGPEGQGLLFPDDAAFDPAMRCRILAAQAISNGAQLFERTRATSVSPGMVETEQGRIRAREVVVAVDGALEKIFPELSTRVRSARLQMLATAPAPEVCWPRPVYSRWGLDYWQQRADCRMVAGGFRDVGGQEEWTLDATPTRAVQNALTGLLREQLGVRAEVTHRWAATVGYTQTGLPILEQLRPSIWAIGAYSGTGNVIGALCGRAVADIIVSGRSAVADMLRA
ncbi:MAG TPA: FAD-dependent oxidoreductase [Gemmatimonadaceae bacterium]|nr:FAD-dependent oxidoreductase [Gemmatimonadaceae bacterium]